MKLNYIKLKNFRSYYGEQTLHFSTDPDQHVTVIHGANGAGKTSLFIAFNWCLYGSEFVREKFGGIGQLENRRALANDENVQTLVEIGFTFRGTKYFARRETLEQSQTSFRLESSDILLNQEASKRIEAIIPRNVSIHFFFDGEKIDNLAMPENKDEVKNAVRNVLRLEQIERGRTHLEAIRREYGKQLKQNAPENLQTLIFDREQQQTTHDKLAEKIKEKEREIKSVQTLIAGIDDRQKTIADSQALAKKRDTINQTLEKLRRDTAEKYTEIHPLANQGFIFLAKPVIEKSLEIFEAQEIPRGIPESLLNDLLKDLECLCGRSIPLNSAEYEHIEKLLDNAVSSESEYIRDTEENLKRLLKHEVAKIPGQLQSNLKAIQQLESDIENNNTCLKDIDKQLGDFDDDEVSQLALARTTHEAEIRKLEADINQYKGQIVQLSKGINKLDKGIKEEEGLEAKTQQLRRYFNLANEAAEAMKNIYDLHASDMREQIQQEVNPIFKDLIWNADHFKTISLTENYQLQVLDDSEANHLPEMSAGQRQVLSLSLIGALAKIAVKNTIPIMENEPFPIVMDTPFGRLSSEHRENITKIFPKIAKQLVLFVTDEELRGKAREILDRYIGAEYQLEFTQENGAEGNITTTKINKRIQ